MQIPRGEQAEVAQKEAAAFGKKDVFGLDVGVQIPRLPQSLERGAQVDAQIDALEMGHGVLVHIGLETLRPGQHGIDVAAHALLLGLGLGAQKGQQVGALGKLLGALGLLNQGLCLPRKVFAGLGLVFAGAGEQQGLDLLASGRDGDLFQHKLPSGLRMTHTVA